MATRSRSPPESSSIRSSRRHEVVGDRRAVHKHFALVGVQQTVEVPDERGLARPVRTSQQDELAVRDTERDTIDCGGSAVVAVVTVVVTLSAGVASAVSVDQISGLYHRISSSSLFPVPISPSSRYSATIWSLRTTPIAAAILNASAGMNAAAPAKNAFWRVMSRTNDITTTPKA